MFRRISCRRSHAALVTDRAIQDAVENKWRPGGCCSCYESCLIAWSLTCSHLNYKPMPSVSLKMITLPGSPPLCGPASEPEVVAPTRLLQLTGSCTQHLMGAWLDQHFRFTVSCQVGLRLSERAIQRRPRREPQGTPYCLGVCQCSSASVNEVFAGTTLVQCAICGTSAYACLVYNAACLEAILKQPVLTFSPARRAC